jgi:uncharacterized membrane protein YfcA
MPEIGHIALFTAFLLVAGLGSGFAGGLFGIGGGILRIPIFLYLFPAFGMDPSEVMHIATGTSLALAIPTGFRSASIQHRSGNLEVPFLRSWIPPLVIGVVAGVFAARVISGKTLSAIFAIAMLGIAIEMLALPQHVRIARAVPGHPVRDLLAGSIGALSTMIGVTGGAFTTPALTLCGVSIHRAVAVAAAGSAAVASVGTLGSVISGLGVAGRPAWALGYVDGLAFIVMLPAIIISAPQGVKLANRLSEEQLRKIFGVFLIFVSADMLRQVFVGF